MNFTELAQLFVQCGNDRDAIANALGITPEMIDQLQCEAMRIANKLTPTAGHDWSVVYDLREAFAACRPDQSPETGLEGIAESRTEMHGDQ